MEETTKASMTKDEMIMELIELLKSNDRGRQAGDVFEMATYINIIGNRLDQMTQEINQMRKEMQAMRDEQVSKSLKEVLSDVVGKAQSRCNEMKQKLLEAKNDMETKAAEIVGDFRQKGKEALNKVADFLGVKEKLSAIREKVREGIRETDQTLARIDGFSEGMRTASRQIADSFRALAGREKIDYVQDDIARDNQSYLRKPWEWQKKVYTGLELHLDAAIDKVDNLRLDVMDRRVQELKDRRKESKAENRENYRISERETSQLSPRRLAVVAEEPPIYGADAFESYMAKQDGKKNVTHTMINRGQMDKHKGR